ncbi:hypothetical protein [Paenibacillus amylolyticus]|uniref:hypothetical protein n=1 Tax=Paenibacillus amylolyticus TaxID=1451 RepID=UPI003D98F572
MTGLTYSNASVQSRVYIVEASEAGFLIVVMDRNLDAQHIVKVLISDTQGGYLATRYLIDKGIPEQLSVIGSDNGEIVETLYTLDIQCVERDFVRLLNLS